MDDTSQVGFALQAGLSVIPCFGEKLEEREAGRTMEVKMMITMMTMTMMMMRRMMTMTMMMMFSGEGGQWR